MYPMTRLQRVNKLLGEGNLDPRGVHGGFIMAASCFLGRCEAIKGTGRVKELGAKEHAVLQFIEEVFECREEIRARRKE